MTKVLIEKFNTEIDRLTGLTTRVPAVSEDRILEAVEMIEFLTDCIKLINRDDILINTKTNSYLLKLTTHIKEYMELITSNINTTLNNIIAPKIEIEIEICESCGCNEGQLTIDPYIADMENSEEEVILCNECYNDRLGNI